ncbi:uncharacterized protein LOC114533452 [Dendronephthya gigantea]|uniref:uncharacterized protein LOC114533452 n=1 Tax=Dendronephthya gigantea TaxID=151771 RepID=UPI00106A3C90|nr:uncharacterized protein LOC114533452 [Dendronephthya gigantea]
MHIYLDGKKVHQSFFRFSVQKSRTEQKYAYVYLGRRPGTKRSLSLRGDLTQVNIWDNFPTFRIPRISTNSACGGGNVVEWKDFLNAISLRDVQLYSCDDCPQRVGFKFDKKEQNNLV